MEHDPSIYDRIRSRVSDVTRQYVQMEMTFAAYIIKLQQNGFNPIAVCIMDGEETFIFNTDDEAKLALLVFEENTTDICPFGYWYGIDQFLKDIEDFKDDLKIYWL